ncbi:co-chaperone HscB [Vibrio sp. 10N.261.55.A7]|uniref:co-chaperone HscB n=1 Tax=Vibrio sp. 10N.261.55.A7 TaxID=1880851 RepID=UPI000C838665|nr:co-chaperone HscB [Vibrio sp. 10N.261.55.A7]PMJ93096.1 co-chaperone HscB [Vibrio sp. 10N.261.55.A7]
MNHFELFGLPIQFPLDGSLLSSQFRELQKRFHPDNFATSSERDRLMSVQQAAQINDAYQALKNPISRAEYLLTVSGYELESEQQTMQDPLFLMDQMELREELEEIESASDAEDKLFDFEQRISKLFKQELGNLEAALEKAEWSLAANLVRKLKFIDKLLQQIEQVEDRLLG